MRYLIAFALLTATSPLAAATVSCTIDGTGATPKLIYGNAADCAFTGKDGGYRLVAKREPKFVLASCWRDGPAGDATACTTGLVRESNDKKAFRIGAYAYPGSGSSSTKAAWVSVSYSY